MKISIDQVLRRGGAVAVAAAGLAFAGVESARAEVVVRTLADHRNPALPGIDMYTASTTAKLCELDLNGDGLIDFQFESQIQRGFDVYPLGGNAVLSRDVDEFTSYAAAMNPGTWVGLGSAVDGMDWNQTLNIPGGFRLGININGCAQRQCVGEFVNTDACMGLRFDIGGQWHYGWVRISQYPTDFAPGFPGGYIREIGFETEPDTGVRIIPEPSTPLIAACGLAGLLWRRRRDVSVR